MSNIRVRTRKDGSLAVCLQWREDGKQRAVTFDDHADALRWKKVLDASGGAEMLRLIDLATGATGSGEQTLTEWCLDYIDHLTGVEKATIERYRAYVRNDITPSIGALPLTAVSDRTIARWVQGMEGSSGKTIANKHGFLSAALAAAVPKHLPSNPCDGTRLPRKNDDESVFLTPAEFAVFREAMPPRWRDFTTWLVSTGMRFSEATALRVGDVDAENGLCRIAKAWKYTGTAERRLSGPKTRRSVRTINLPPEALAVVDLERSNDELLFPTRTGSAIRAQLYHNKGWRPALANLIVRDDVGKELKGLHKLGGKRPTPHDLRHTCASWMIAAGVPLPVIQAHLGHESITTTIDRYGHLDRTTKKVAAAAIAQAFSSIAS